VKALAAAVLAAIALTGACSDSKKPAVADSTFDPFATNASSGPVRTPTAPATLGVGDCFNTTGFSPGTSIDRGAIFVVPCVDPHQHEVYAVEGGADAGNLSFPGDKTMSAFADDRCLAAFAPAIGVDYRKSSLDFATITPDATSWTKGDRAVICAVHDGNFAELTGSVRSTTTTSLAARSG
jgi:hypothetical protein